MYKPGSHWKICDRTGFKVRAEDTREEWNGLIVSSAVYEARHPQDMVRARKDDQSVRKARPRKPDTWVTMPTVLYAEDGDLLQAESDSLLTEE